MLRYISNIIVKFILRADEGLLQELFDKLKKISIDNRYNAYRRIYEIHPQFRFNGTDILFYGEGKIICGENSYIGNYSTAQAALGYKIVIGKNCSISHNVRIYTATSVSNQDMNTKSPKITKYGDVIIEDGVWIGANVFIVPGVKIGKNSIVGANSVVSKNIAENGIYGGVPAKLIKFKTI